MNEPLSRHQILLYEGDIERLKEYYTIRSASDVIRTLLRKHLERLDAKLVQQKERQNA